MEVAAAIIAGGRARRLGGVAKPLLMVGGRTVADRQLAVLRPIFARVLAVVAEPADAAAWGVLGVQAVADRVQGAGPLAGVAAALAAAGGQAVVCVAGDMPFLWPPLLCALRDQSPQADALSPRRGGRAEPLCARYAGRLLPQVEARLAAGRLALHVLLEETAGTSWLDDAQLNELGAGDEAFFNLNGPDDLARAEGLARSRG
ncbi:MAG TPA: NTP transferase domain-containing protein [Polyangia bacterium]|nr:NTP transferase domain-containing protein [Polyangia bacterium]